MAIMDYRAQLCDATTFSGAVAATVISTYIVDLGHAKAYPGRGEPIYLHVRTKTAFASTKPLTCTLSLYLQDANTNSAASFSNLINLNLDGASSMTCNKIATAGKLIYSAPLPPTCKRYLRIKGTIAVTPITGGQVDAWLDIASLPKTYE